MQKINQNAVTGTLFVAIGGFFAIYSFVALEIGTAFTMGPGYFPLILGTALAIIGVLIATRPQSGESEARPVPWRGLLLVLIAPTTLGLTIRTAGLLPSVAAMVAIAAFATPTMSVRTALVLTVSITVFCFLVFHVALGLPIQLFGRLASLF